MLEDNVPLCRLPWTAAFILENGDMFNCCHQVKPFANLNYGAFEELYNSPALQKIRLSLMRGEIPHEYCRCIEKIGKIPIQDINDPHMPFEDYEFSENKNSVVKQDDSVIVLRVL